MIYAANYKKIARKQRQADSNRVNRKRVLFYTLCDECYLASNRKLFASPAPPRQITSVNSSVAAPSGGSRDQTEVALFAVWLMYSLLKPQLRKAYLCSLRYQLTILYAQGQTGSLLCGLRWYLPRSYLLRRSFA